MSPIAQPLSPVFPISEIVRDEIIALLADPLDVVPPGVDVRTGMDPVEIAQDERDADDVEVTDLVRISPSVPI